MRKKILSLLSIVCIATGLLAQQKPKQPVAPIKKTTTNLSKPIVLKPKETLVEITTPFGVMIAKLYNETPLHRDNFIKLIKQGFYDSLLFHRIISGFMIQGGDPTSKNADSTVVLGSGAASGERIAAEFRTQFFHKKGALAAARDGNAEKASSNCQFYIVQGNKTDSTQLNQIQQNIRTSNPNFSYTKAQIETYQRIGGTAFLDQNYTVFGEIIVGLNILDKIAASKTRPGDRPFKDVMMKMRIIN